MKSKIRILVATTALSIGGAGFALAAPVAQRGPSAAPDASSAPVALKMTSGEVRKVDNEQGKVTIKHDAIDNLGMPGMTMVFRAANPALLHALKTGDKILFRAEKIVGGLTVTAIQSVK